MEETLISDQLDFMSTLLLKNKVQTNRNIKILIDKAFVKQTNKKKLHMPVKHEHLSFPLYGHISSRSSFLFTITSACIYIHI